MEMHVFHLNVRHNIQALQEYYIAVIYLIVLSGVINLETFGHMKGHFQTSHSHQLVLLIFMFEHTVQCLCRLAFTGFGHVYCGKWAQ
jgi:hypothetical protein